MRSHVLGEYLVILLIEYVHLLVLRNHCACGGRITIAKGIKRGFEHVKCKMGHVRQIEFNFNKGFFAQVAGALGDFLCFIADTFEILGNFYCYSYQAQIGGERRLGELLNYPIVNFDLELVNNSIIFLDPHCQILVALVQCL